MREALARGGDRGVILSDKAFAGGDTLSTSYVLSKGIKKLGGADLILMGAASDDGGTGQLGAQLAEWLGMRHLHNAVNVEYADKRLNVTTLADRHIFKWECELPALVTVNRKINKPGPVPARNIIMATRKELSVWSADDIPELDRNNIGLKNSPTQNGEQHPMDTERAGIIVEGDEDEIAENILEQLSDAGIEF